MNKQLHTLTKRIKLEVAFVHSLALSLDGHTPSLAKRISRHGMEPNKKLSRTKAGTHGRKIELAMNTTYFPLSLIDWPADRKAKTD